MRIKLITLLLIAFCQLPIANSQTLLPATFIDKTNPIFLSFYLPAKELREKISVAEELTDLVQCFSVDSILKRRKQRHRVIGSPVIDLLGWNWRAVQRNKQKVVGTVRKIGGVAEKPHFRELDVNYDLIPHTQKYIDIYYRGYQAQMKTRKAARQRDFSQPPFTYPTPETIDNYRVHCECTPYFKEGYREKINENLYPVLSGANLTTHKNFMHEHPTMGMYGAFVLDCNHSCHPEIHPYEWLWWLDLNPEKDNVQDKISWIFGYLRDVSQRQRNWVKKPRSGAISFPFIFKIDTKNKEIFIEHTITQKWCPDGLPRIKGIPDSAVTLDFDTLVFDVGRPGNSITLKSNQKLPADAGKLWLSNLNVDEKNGYVTGYVNLALSIENVYTGRVTMSKLQLSMPNPK
jgi:hypothetical protein